MNRTLIKLSGSVRRCKPFRLRALTNHIPGKSILQLVKSVPWQDSSNNESRTLHESTGRKRMFEIKLDAVYGRRNVTQVFYGGTMGRKRNAFRNAAFSKRRTVSLPSNLKKDAPKNRQGDAKTLVLGRKWNPYAFWLKKILSMNEPNSLLPLPGGKQPAIFIRII